MAKKQTRRSISINRKLYDRVKELCAATGTPISSLTEAALEVVLDAKAANKKQPQTAVEDVHA